MQRIIDFCNLDNFEIYMFVYLMEMFKLSKYIDYRKTPFLAELCNK